MSEPGKRKLSGGEYAIPPWDPSKPRVKVASPSGEPLRDDGLPTEHDWRVIALRQGGRRLPHSS